MTTGVATIVLWSVLLAITSRYAIWYVSTFRKALRIEGSTPLPSIRIYTPRYSPLIYMRYAVRDGIWQHKGTLPRKELGSDVYWMLGPGGPQLWVADPDLISEITHRWKDFPKPVMYYTQLQLFGENVLTAEGPLWQFHWKITIRLVFAESQEQAKAMVRSWSKESREKRESASSAITVDDLENSVRKLALHIISAAGFGHQMQWDESLKTFVDEVWLLMIFPSWLRKFSPSAHLRRVHKAPSIFAKHVQQAINETKAEDNMRKSARRNDLLSNMINSDGVSHGSDKDGLSDEEITSNVHKELDTIYGEKSEGVGLAYETDYPKMRHLIGPDAGNAPPIPLDIRYPQMDRRQTPDCALQRPNIRYPPNTSIVLDVVAVHRNPRYWGDDAHVFRPSRWLMDETYEPPADSVSHSKHHANLLGPRKGAFVVFSDGHRDCLGKGFAQAEFCAVIATLLKDCSIELVPPEGATPSDEVWSTMCQDAWKALDDRRNMTSFKMYGKVPVRFVPRGSEWRR
ncbi:cytochrome P450 [Aspergillus novofumigatus IBT 16806]|uniref:Cytochrome P450 n=1 Tax=Aspergillus novofumigatus (strain IBT 16806) TaxID=1392255 RepID=A0A2I1CEA8_ASPN1|nr:cytochrome P450 [Aspergillus novofumigatus IBT 16806]PKX95961.1 cytochrome P450 [Aspergillus novofumigatus IBT 16806]